MLAAALDLGISRTVISIFLRRNQTKPYKGIFMFRKL